jgi:activator-of-BECN1-regulated-autophagy protein 1
MSHRLRQLHPDYSYSLLNDSISNRESEFQASVNRTIAEALMASRESAIASNIVKLTHRIQRWDLSKGEVPEISDANRNVVIPFCKLHNDATAEISQDGKLMSVFVPSHQGFPDDLILGVFSLEAHNLGQCLYTKSFGKYME